MGYDFCISLYACHFLQLISEVSPADHGLLIHCGECSEPESAQCLDDGVDCEGMLPILLRISFRQLLLQYLEYNHRYEACKEVGLYAVLS